MAATVASGVIRLMGPDFDPDNPTKFDDENQEASDNFWARVNDAESMISDMMPEGYYVKVEQA